MKTVAAHQVPCNAITVW